MTFVSHHHYPGVLSPPPWLQTSNCNSQLASVLVLRQLMKRDSQSARARLAYARMRRAAKTLRLYAFIVWSARWSSETESERKMSTYVCFHKRRSDGIYLGDLGGWRCVTRWVLKSGGTKETRIRVSESSEWWVGVVMFLARRESQKLMLYFIWPCDSSYKKRGRERSQMRRTRE